MRYINLPGSGTHQVIDLVKKSNVAKLGKWIYRTDSLAGDCDTDGRSCC